VITTSDALRAARVLRVIVELQIAENAGTEGAVVLERVKEQEFGFGWNAATGVYENLLESGVIDPATVTQQAVLNSASIAASVITTSVRAVTRTWRLSDARASAATAETRRRCGPPVASLSRAVHTLAGVHACRR
jgi:hypothetical protein